MREEMDEMPILDEVGALTGDDESDSLLLVSRW